jgi:hypothetical protein
MNEYRVSTYGNIQAAVNAMQAAGGGKVIVDQPCPITSPVVFNGVQQPFVVGEGEAAPIYYTTSSTQAIVQIAPATYGGNLPYFEGVCFQDRFTANSLAVFLKNVGAPVFRDCYFLGTSTHLWCVNTFGVSVTGGVMQGHRYCGLGFDPATPCNNLVLRDVKVFSGAAPLILSLLQADGIDIEGCDIETGTVVLQTGAGTVSDAVRISGTDMEGLTGGLFANGGTINGLVVENNTIAGCGDTHLTGVTTGRFTDNQLYNSNVLTAGSTNFDCVAANNVLRGTSTIV